MADDEGDDRAALTRLCALTREVRPVEELIRFVRAPDGRLAADMKRKLPGRGVWITARKRAVAEAVRKKVFARGLKAPVEAPADLADQVEGLLAKAALEMLAMANKAGRLVLGFGQVETALASGKAVALLHAAEAKEDGKRKLGAAMRRAGNEDATAILTLFGSQQMDLALGRANVIHAALLAGPVSDGFLARAEALARYRDDPVAAQGQPAETEV